MCGDVCADNNACTSFAWSKFEGGTCWLKNGKVTERDGVPWKGVIAGIANRDQSGRGKSHFFLTFIQ
jgi:hypothetical protein